MITNSKTFQCYALGMGIKQISRSFELSCSTQCAEDVRCFKSVAYRQLAGRHASARIQEMFSEVYNNVTGNRHNASLSWRHL